jgi:glutamine phosphoribosylpyrophosphate amidotransferase
VAIITCSIALVEEGTIVVDLEGIGASCSLSLHTWVANYGLGIVIVVLGLGVSIEG